MTTLLTVLIAVAYVGTGFISTILLYADKESNAFLRIYSIILWPVVMIRYIIFPY